MVKLSFVDLQILLLGIKGDGRFDEKDIEKSDLKELGVGRILDQLASLTERKLIEMNKNGSFSVTNIARHVLWDRQTPLWIKILRILEVKSQTLEKISSSLLLSSGQILKEIEDLRKRQLVLMLPIRNESGIVKVYELLPDGIEQVKKTQANESLDKPEITKQQIEIWLILEEIISEIKVLEELSQEKKDKIISRILQIKSKLEI